MVMPWERNWGSPALPPEDDEVEGYIREAATKRGIPVEDALAVWAGEGKGAWQSNFRKGGKREPSYGPYQLYTEGGLGNSFQKDTGLDPSDPATWKQGIDYALDTAKKEGWRQWYGAPEHLRARGGYVDMGAPGLGAQGALPWQRDWGGKWNPPQQPEQAAPSPSPAPAGDFTMENKWGAPSGLVDNFVGGVERGAIGLAGLPGDAQAFLRPHLPKEGWLSQRTLLPEKDLTTEELTKMYEGNVRKLPVPQTVAEEYAGTIGSFAPAVLAGPGGIARRIAQAVVPGVLSETGGQIGRKISPEAEIVGRIGGGLYGGLKMSKPRLPKGPQSTDEVKALAQQNYDMAEQAGLQINGASFFNFVNSLRGDKVVKGLKLNPKLHEKLSSVVEEIEGIITAPPKQSPMQAMTGVTKQWHPGTMDLQTFDNLRRNLLAAAKSADADERRVAGHIIDRMDDWFDRLGSADISAGDLGQARRALYQARDLWRKYRKSEEIDTILEVAKDRTGQFSLSGKDNALRTGFRQLSIKIAKDPRTAKRFTDDEKKIIRQLSRGWTPRRFLSLIGKLSPNSLSMTAGGLYGAHTGDWGTAATLAGVGSVARGTAGALAQRKANRLGQLVRGGGHQVPGGRSLVPLSGVSASEPYRSDGQ